MPLAHVVLLETMVALVELATLDRLDELELLEPEVFRESQVWEGQVPQDRTALTVALVPQVFVVPLVPMDAPELPAQEVPMDVLALLEQLDLKVPLVPREELVRLAVMAQLVPQEELVQLVVREELVPLEVREMMAEMDEQEVLEQLVLEV